ncbi:tyrosine-type recombinase/integrase [Chitinophaga rhizophila]|uniref:Tyrosine-type recombinase/integrase n=1 Tax=Chitinophaga rhizophila TaxID=2866212 RepID=A0ABS7G982_9BACT|nr:tyrosine-type recombinase/integrase [Chitinophaga rhizophila]MBW8684219.1 tyrosine-type recombinase/integrase [Chitinophaga rhizophila]
MSEVLHPVANQFLAYIQYQKRYSAHTFTAYQQDLTQFFIFLKSQYGDVSLPDISHLHVRSWLASLMREGMLAKSINRKISTLKSFYKYAMRHKEVTTTPMTKVTAPKIGVRLPAFIDEKGMKALADNRSLRRGNEGEPIFSDDLTGKTHRLIFEMFYQTGIRLSELMGLKARHVDGIRLTIKVMGKGSKERIIPISEGLLKQILEYRAMCKRDLAEPDPEILIMNPQSGKPLYSRYVYNVVHTYLTYHELTTISRRSPHIIRHTFATHLTNNGADLNAVKDLLGHASLASTQVYTHNSIDRLKDAYRKAHPKGE